MGLKKKKVLPATPPIEEEISQAVEAPATPQVPAQTQVQAPATVVPEVPVEKPAEQPKAIYVPQYLSQDQINNLVIETHLMVKEILSIATEE